MGGIFIFAADPNALATWYRDIFGVHTQADGETHFAELPSADLHPSDRISTLTFAIMPSTGPLSDHKTAQINWRVTDLDSAIAVLEGHGVEVTRKRHMDDYGRFAWCHDPEGNKIELWEPPTPDVAERLNAEIDARSKISTVRQK
jgi:predicted enzyme related to lactoylglutathione lyase